MVSFPKSGHIYVLFVFIYFMLYNMFVLNDTYIASSNVEWPGAKIMLTLVMFSEPLKRCIATYMLLIQDSSYSYVTSYS